jgi:uncharacterized protein YndB with AHSA1/START domain
METTDSVSEEMEIDAPIERVFDALSSAEQLGMWWGSSDSYRTSWTIDLRPGGELICRAMAGETEMFVRGRFLVVERPTRLSHTWNASWDPSGETRVDYVLTERGDRTHVRVTQSGFAPDADRAGYQEGWGRILGWLEMWIRP